MDSLPPVDPRAADIVKTIAEFEASVGDAENALVARDWPRLDALLADQHRLTHALANLLDATRNARPAAFNDEIDRHLAGISDRRADQMRRLMAFNHVVKQRLTVISRTRDMRRVNVASASPPRILDLLQ